MLILTRNAHESIVIDNTTTVKVLEVKGKRVVLGITAPPEVRVHRSEIQERVDAGEPAPPKPATNPVLDAMRVVIKALSEDDELAWGWHCNLALAAQDSGMEWSESQIMARRFMGWAFQRSDYPDFNAQLDAGEQPKAAEAQA